MISEGTKLDKNNSRLGPVCVSLEYQVRVSELYFMDNKETLNIFEQRTDRIKMIF